MKRQHPLRSVVMGVGLIAAALVVDGWLPIGLVGEAEARVGRPATPVSVAGVARRTTRRTVRRTAVYVAALPRGCTTVNIDGTTLHRCGGTYYQPYGGRYVVVNVD